MAYDPIEDLSDQETLAPTSIPLATFSSVPNHTLLMRHLKAEGSSGLDVEEAVSNTESTLWSCVKFWLTLPCLFYLFTLPLLLTLEGKYLMFGLDVFVAHATLYLICWSAAFRATQLKETINTIKVELELNVGTQRLSDQEVKAVAMDIKKQYYRLISPWMLALYWGIILLTVGLAHALMVFFSFPSAPAT